MHTGFLCVSAESSRAVRAARCGSPAAQTPIGETRISEPFDSLSVVCMPSSPRSVVAPMSTGREVSHSRYASRTLSGTKSLAGDQAARQRERHLAVVGRLAGDGVVHAAVGQRAHALREEARDLGGGLELDQRAEAVADHLAEQAALRAREHRLRAPCAGSRARRAP